MLGPAIYHPNTHAYGRDCDTVANIKSDTDGVANGHGTPDTDANPDTITNTDGHTNAGSDIDPDTGWGRIRIQGAE